VVEFLVSSSLASPCLMEANMSASFTTSIRAMNGIELWMDILPNLFKVPGNMLNFDIPIGTQRNPKMPQCQSQASSRPMGGAPLSPEDDYWIVVFILVK